MLFRSTGLDIGHPPDGQEDAAAGADLDDDAERSRGLPGSEQHDDVADLADGITQGVENSGADEARDVHTRCLHRHRLRVPRKTHTIPP